ncbi:UNVERIFIED_CONTAM: hypothetical protein FKN15_020421 [Acipenser sinensis]
MDGRKQTLLTVRFVYLVLGCTEDPRVCPAARLTVSSRGRGVKNQQLPWTASILRERKRGRERETEGGEREERGRERETEGGEREREEREREERERQREERERDRGRRDREGGEREER